MNEKLSLAFSIYDMDQDGYISNGDLFKCLKMLCGDNISNIQIQQLVDRTIIRVDKDEDGKISMEDFTEAVKDLDINEYFSLDLFG
jgi:serine/threonine-protein phosphatase 2B regulatory subunit